MDIALFSPISGLGKLALTLGCVAGFAAAIWIIHRHRRAKDSSFFLAMLVAVFGSCGTAVAVNMVEESALQLNPTFSAAQLAGVWTYGSSTLRLGRDGTYDCTPTALCGDLTAAGRWSRSADFDVILMPVGGGSITRRVITFAGAFRLTQMDDIDLWNRQLTFKHRAPASLAGALRL